VNFSQFLAKAHIKVNCDEMAGDRPRQPGNESFGIKLRLQQFKSRPSRFKEACLGKHQKGLLPKKWLFCRY